MGISTFLGSSPTCPKCRRVVEEFKYHGPPPSVCTRIKSKMHTILDVVSLVLILIVVGKQDWPGEGLRVRYFFDDHASEVLLFSYILTKYILNCLGVKCMCFPQTRLQVWVSIAVFVVVLDFFILFLIHPW